MLNLTFCRVRKQATAKCSFSFLTWIRFYFYRSKRIGIIAMKINSQSANPLFMQHFGSPCRRPSFHLHLVGLCTSRTIINNFTLRVYLVFLELKGWHQKVIGLFYWTYQHPGPHSELKIGQFRAMFFHQSFVDVWKVVLPIVPFTLKFKRHADKRKTNEQKLAMQTEFKGK